MRKTLPQYNENQYHNLTAGSSGVWKFVSRVKNSISVIPIFIPNPYYIPKNLSRFPTRLDFIPIWETLPLIASFIEMCWNSCNIEMISA